MDTEKQGAFIKEMAGVVKTLAARMQEQQIVAEEAIGEMRKAVSALCQAATECRALRAAVSENIDETIRSAMSGAGVDVHPILTHFGP